jgi:hypothetical protein
MIIAILFQSIKPLMGDKMAKKKNRNGFQPMLLMHQQWGVTKCKKVKLSAPERPRHIYDMAG